MRKYFQKMFSGWGFSWEGLIDNRQGEWWVLGQLMFIFAHLFKAWPHLEVLVFVWSWYLSVVGIFLFYPIIVLAIKESYKSLQNNRYKYIISPFFYIFIMEVFPIKSSGSFFTTNNSVIIFLTLAMIVGLSSKYKKEYS